jgi:hypothetical protein
LDLIHDIQILPISGHVMISAKCGTDFNKFKNELFKHGIEIASHKKKPDIIINPEIEEIISTDCKC